MNSSKIPRLVFALVVVGPPCFVASAQAQQLVLVAGKGSPSPASAGDLNGPFGVDADPAGNLYIPEIAGHRIWRLDRAGTLAVFAGTGQKGFAGDGGPAAKAQFNQMHNLAIAPSGDIYVADTHNSRVRKIDGKTGVVSTFAGTGEHGDSGDGGDGGPATAAKLGHIYCASLNPSGTKLHLVDLDHRRVRAVTLADGKIETVAGNGKKGVPADDSVAKDSPLVDPRAAAIDAKGNVYVLERSGHALRVVDGEGRIRTVAGTGQKGSKGDGGPALAAEFNGPKHLCVDRAGDVIVADAENNLIRKYLVREKRMERVAGNGKQGVAGLGGDPLAAELNRPHGVFVDRTGTLYIVDSFNDRLLKIVP